MKTPAKLTKKHTPATTARGQPGNFLLLRHDDPRLSWEGALSLERHPPWTAPWRLPFASRALFHSALHMRAAMPCGVRLTFGSDSTFLEGRVVPCAESSPADLFCDGRFFGSAALTGQDHFRFDSLPAGRKKLELWLPQFGTFRLRSLALSPHARVIPLRDRRPRWITYGSSITQCRTAFSPSQTWPALVAQRHGVHLTCLGFGGQCHLDPMVARLIRDLPADFISLCVGINIYGQSSLKPRSFQPALIGFIKTIRDRHPAIPLAVISPIFSCHRENTPNAAGFTLPAIRQEIAAAVALLKAHGDKHLAYFNGLSLLDARAARLLPDRLHPTGEGYRLMAEKFSAKIGPFLFGRVRRGIG